MTFEIPLPVPSAATFPVAVAPDVTLAWPLEGGVDGEEGDRGVELRDRELEILVGTLEIVERADRATERRELESGSRGADVGPLERMRLVGSPDRESVEPRCERLTDARDI